MKLDVCKKVITCIYIYTSDTRNINNLSKNIKKRYDNLQFNARGIVFCL